MAQQVEDPSQQTTENEAESVKKVPRFFIELNEPILIKGKFNPDGIGLPILLSAFWFGLGMWTAFLLTLLAGIWLCRVMAINPTLIQELRVRFHRRQQVVAMDGEFMPRLRIVTSTGTWPVAVWRSQQHHRGGERVHC